MGGDYLLCINYPLILFFKIIRGLSPLDFFKIDPLSDHQDQDQEGGVGGGGVNPLFASR